MPPSSFSPLTPRWCASCQQPLHGRSDKKYCGDACRSMGNRHGLAEEAALDWPARLAAAEQTAQALQAQLDAQAQAGQAAFGFELGYDSLAMLVINAVSEVEELSAFPRFLAAIDEMLAYFAQHPGLGTGDVHAQRRLGYLQQVRVSIVTRYNRLQHQAAKRLAAAGGTGAT